MSYLNPSALIPDSLRPPTLPWAASPSPVFEDRGQSEVWVDSLKDYLGRVTDDLMAELPAAQQLSSAERRGMIARYTAVLEGNFIYWMTGTYLASKSEVTREILLENLHEEVRDSHPEMLRRFASAAHAVPDDADAQAVHAHLSKVRLFIGRLSAVPSLAMMAFFEGLIQKFMPYLADLAARQGSAEMEYTDVHGTCDIVHSQELFRALAAEMALSDSPVSARSLFEGVFLLRELLQAIVFPSGGDGLGKSV